MRGWPVTATQHRAAGSDLFVDMIAADLARAERRVAMSVGDSGRCLWESVSVTCRAIASPERYGGEPPGAHATEGVLRSKR